MVAANPTYRFLFASKQPGARMPIPPRNVAELLCDLGQVLRWSMSRSGAGTKREAATTQLRGGGTHVSQQFVKLSLSVQLRAMVEDWSLHQILEAIRAQGNEPLCPKETHSRK